MGYPGMGTGNQKSPGNHSKHCKMQAPTPNLYATNFVNAFGKNKPRIDSLLEFMIGDQISYWKEVFEGKITVSPDIVFANAQALLDYGWSFPAVVTYVKRCGHVMGRVTLYAFENDDLPIKRWCMVVYDDLWQFTYKE
jgi:hypothetical protein